MVSGLSCNAAYIRTRKKYFPEIKNENIPKNLGDDIKDIIFFLFLKFLVFSIYKFHSKPLFDKNHYVINIWAVSI